MMLRSLVPNLLILAALFQTAESFIGFSKREHSKTMCLSKANSSDGEEFEVLTKNPLRLAVLRLGMTELRYTSPFNYGDKDGIFRCAYCGQELFDSNSKYDSKSGWPSFFRTISEGKVAYKREFDGRLECTCSRCNSHLGHVFLDGPRPTDVERSLIESSPPSDPRSSRSDGRLPRFCVNGASMTLESRNE